MSPALTAAVIVAAYMAGAVCVAPALVLGLLVLRGLVRGRL